MCTWWAAFVYLYWYVNFFLSLIYFQLSALYRYQINKNINKINEILSLFRTLKFYLWMLFNCIYVYFMYQVVRKNIWCISIMTKIRTCVSLIKNIWSFDLKKYICQRIVSQNKRKTLNERLVLRAGLYYTYVVRDRGITELS